MLNNEKDVNDVTVRALLKIGCDNLSWVLDCDDVKDISCMTHMFGNIDGIFAFREVLVKKLEESDESVCETENSISE